MFNKSSILLVSVASILVACSGGGSGSGGSGGMGGSGGSGGSTPTEVNPFANGNVPTTKETVEIQSSGELDAKITLDPINKTYVWANEIVVFEGAYDPARGVLTSVTSCESNDPDYCNHDPDDDSFEEFSILDIFTDAEGKGLVLLYSGDVEYSPRIIGYNPTGASALPSSGVVTYEGQAAYHSYDSDGVESDEGNATTSVNFGDGTLSASFDGFGSGASAELTGVELTGSHFSGGEFTGEMADGTVLSGGETQVYGQFYGEAGQELGASLSYEQTGENRVDLSGAWTGVAQN